MMLNTGVIREVRIVGHQSISEPADVYFENGIIRSIGQSIPVPGEVEEYVGVGEYILPGFVDVHFHGSMGFDTTFGTYLREQDKFNIEEEEYYESLKAAIGHRQQHGVTKMLLTTMSAPLEDLQKALCLVAKALADIPEVQRAIAGVNLEGTFLKDPQFAGAQNPLFFLEPSLEIYNLLQNASGGNIRIVNVVPEYGQPALDLIDAIGSDQVKAAAGHTGANYRELQLAAKAGLSLGVHFLNGPALSSKKSFHGGGAEEAMLSNDDLFLELILDGYHVHPAYVRDVINRKEASRVIGISDAMFVNGLTLEKFTVAGLRGQVSSDATYLQSLEDPSSLFGSVLNMDQGYSNLVNWLASEMNGFWTRSHPALSLEEAMCQASRICSLNPARYLGLLDPLEGAGTGCLEVGKKADILLADWHSGDRPRLICQATFSEGYLI